MWPNEKTCHCTVRVVFSRRFSSEKSPTITVASFFRQTTDLIVYVPLFSTDFTRFTVNPAVTGSIPCFSQKLFSIICESGRDWRVTSSNFFGTVRLFFRFFLLQRVLQVFQSFKVAKSPKGLPFKYFGIMRLQFFFVFKNFLKMSKFFCLQKVPLQFFWYFATDWIFKKPVGAPFTVLKTLRFLSLRYNADFRRSSLVCYKKRRLQIEYTNTKYSTPRDFFFANLSRKWWKHFSYNMYSFWISLQKTRG